MTGDERVIALLRAGLGTEVIAAILDTDLATVEDVVGDPAHHNLPAAGVSLAPNGAFGDPTVAPCFLGWFPNANDLLVLDTTGWKQGCWALAGNPADNMGYALAPSLWVLDVDSGSWQRLTGAGAI